MTVEFTNREIIPNSNHKESLPINPSEGDDHVFVPLPTTTAPIPSLLDGNWIDHGTNGGNDSLKDNTTTTGASAAAAEDERNPLYLEENLLPISVIAKIAKFAMIPGSASNTAAVANDDAGGKESEVVSASSSASTIALSKEAKEVLARSCTVFINCLTATAIAHSDKVKAKTIGTEQVYRALKVMEFDQSILEQVKTATSIHAAIQKEKRDTYRKSVKEKKVAKETTTAAPSGDDGMQIDRADDHHDKDNQQAQGDEGDEEDVMVAIPQKRPADEALVRDHHDQEMHE